MADNKKKDIGFGKETGKTVNRGLNNDGTFNVERKGISFFESFELYHWLLSMTWKKFTLIVLVWYSVINLIFAMLYHLFAPGQLTSIETGGACMQHFLEEFFFSSQTLTTLGYGRVAPSGLAASTIAAIESMFGLMGFAFFTGLLYGRFSKPYARILFSKNAVIAPYEGATGLMFRIVNQRNNQLIETEAEVYGTFRDRYGNPDFANFKLEMKKINLFPLSWTIVHPIDKESPFYGMEEEEFRKTNLEVFVIIKAFDESFSQTVYARRSYILDEMIWGAKFNTMVEFGDDGRRKLHLDKLNSFNKVDIKVPKPELA